MGLPTNLSTLLSGDIVEWERIEFKETWDAEASLKTICAFANDIDNWGGGYIVIGVSAKGDGTPAKLVGIDPASADRSLKDMLNKCKLIQPGYMPITEVATYEGKTFIIIWAPGGSQRPYSAPKTMGKKNSERIYWIRKMNSTIKPSETEKSELYTLANNVPFDDRVNHSASLDDFNISLIKGYLSEVGSSLYPEVDNMNFVNLCKSMNIADGPDEYVKPKNVGLMFFTMEPERFFPYARIEIVEFPDGEGGNQLYERTFTGPLHQQLRDALLYLKNNIIEEHITKKPQEAEAERFYNYPYAAIEESLSNAVYHKGYDSREPIEVRILPDRIEILSHPGADRSISIEGLRAYRALSRRYRNRRVGEFLKELRLTEGRNTGLQKIVRASRENGSPDPLFETDEDRLYFLVTLYAREDDQVNTDSSSKASLAESEQSESNSRERQTELRRRHLLQFFKDYPSATIQEAADSINAARATIDRDISILKAERRLKRIGPRNGGSWIIERND